MCSSTCTHWAFGFCFPHTAVPYGHRHISRFILRRSKFHIFVQFGCVFGLFGAGLLMSHTLTSYRLGCNVWFFVRFRVSCVRVSERVIVVTVLWIFVAAAAKTHKHFKCVFRVHSLVLYRRRGTEPNPYLPHLLWSLLPIPQNFIWNNKIDDTHESFTECSTTKLFEALTHPSRATHTHTQRLQWQTDIKCDERNSSSISNENSSATQSTIDDKSTTRPAKHTLSFDVFFGTEIACHSVSEKRKHFSRSFWSFSSSIRIQSENKIQQFSLLLLLVRTASYPVLSQLRKKHSFFGCVCVSEREKNERKRVFTVFMCEILESFSTSGELINRWMHSVVVMLWSHEFWI